MSFARVKNVNVYTEGNTMDGETIPTPQLSSDAPGQQLPLAAPPGEKKKRHRRTKAELEAARKGEAGEQDRKSVV